MAYANQYNSNPRNNGTNYVRNNNNRQNASQKTSHDSQTDGVLLVNEKMGKFLRTRYWNRFMTIDIGTFQPGTPVDYNTIRNAQVFSAVCSFSTMFSLRMIMEEVLESLKQTNTFESTAVDGNQKKDTIIEISNGSNINQPMGLYLVIYKNVDSGRRTNIFEVYPFTSCKIMRGYDHNTGSCKEDVKAIGEFKKFKMIVDEACKAFTMAQAHSVKEASKMERLSGINALAAIGASMGVDLMKSVTVATSGGSRTTGQSSYNRSNNNGYGNNNNNGLGPNPNNYRRTSQSGQWNRGGQYGGNRQNGAPNEATSYQQTQNAMNQINDEPVDINLSSATLQQVSLEDFA